MRTRIARNGTLLIAAEDPTEDFALHAWLHANSKHVAGAKISFKNPTGAPIFDPETGEDRIEAGLTEPAPRWVDKSKF